MDEASEKALKWKLRQLHHCAFLGFWPTENSVTRTLYPLTARHGTLLVSSNNKLYKKCLNNYDFVITSTSTSFVLIF